MLYFIISREVTYHLIWLAILASNRLPERNVTTPRPARYFNVVNMFNSNQNQTNSINIPKIINTITF